MSFAVIVSFSLQSISFFVVTTGVTFTIGFITSFVCVIVTFGAVMMMSFTVITVRDGGAPRDDQKTDEKTKLNNSSHLYFRSISGIELERKLTDGRKEKRILFSQKIDGE